jgi:hypothetical protein
VGENEVYRWNGDGEPEPLCGDGMREEIMSKASTTWCESQAAPSNRALLTVDQKNREVHVYTQKGKVYVYSIDRNAWTYYDVDGGYEICDLIYNPTTGNFYAAFSSAAAGTAGVARLDATQTGANDSISNSGTVALSAEAWFAPIEMTGPRYDLLVETLRVQHAITGDQTAQTTTAYVSKDQGQTFPKSHAVTVYPLSGGEYRPMSISLFQSFGTLLIKLVHVGKGWRRQLELLPSGGRRAGVAR